MKARLTSRRGRGGFVRLLTGKVKSSLAVLVVVSASLVGLAVTSGSGAGAGSASSAGGDDDVVDAEIVDEDK